MKEKNEIKVCISPRSFSSQPQIINGLVISVSVLLPKASMSLPGTLLQLKTYRSLQVCVHGT